MKTNLVIKEANIVPGKEIEMISYNCRNFRIHLAAAHLSRMMLAMVENQSGNMTGDVVPRNVRDLISQFALIKQEIEFARTHNDPPEATHEEAYKILLLKGNEIQNMDNVKEQRVAKELDLLARVMLSVDSARTQGNISSKDLATIDAQIAVADDAIKIWLGTGASVDETGIEVPAFMHLGELVPDVDMDFRQTLEPSKDLPSPALPDVPDLPSDSKQ